MEILLDTQFSYCIIDNFNSVLHERIWQFHTYYNKLPKGYFYVFENILTLFLYYLLFFSISSASIYDDLWFAFCHSIKWYIRIMAIDNFITIVPCLKLAFKFVMSSPYYKKIATIMDKADIWGLEAYKT